MKKLTFFAFLCLTAVSANAQLKVNANGDVEICSTSSNNNRPKLSVGVSSSSNSSISYGIVSSPTITNNRNVAVEGRIVANQSNTSDSNFGVAAISGLNLNHGRNYGLFGTLYFGTPTSNTGGAGVYATNYAYVYQNPSSLPGIYAAYFTGNTNLQGRTTAQEIYTPADDQLGEDVEFVADANRDGDGTLTLDNLLKMNVKEFNLKNTQKVEAPERGEEMTEEVRQSYEYMKKDLEEVYSRRHFGVSAQELQKIYPDLVLKGQDGYLYVNYTEMVPLLLRSIQELKQQLDEVKDSKNDEAAKARGFEGSIEDDEETSNLTDVTAIPATATLAQNVPNPFTERTTIRFTLPDDTKNACICIFDLSGKMLKQIPIDATMQSITIEGYELQAGMYIYSLLINGKEIKTRRMILSK